MKKKYIAFISYRNVPLDSAAAKMLHRRIERYIIPKVLRKNGKRFGAVFRDKEEMSASHNLRQDLKDALDNSEFLILVCSPDTAKSKWVKEEIEYFLQHHDSDKVFTVLTGGEAEDVVPKILQYSKDAATGKTEKIIPLAVDARGETPKEVRKKLERDITRLYSGMLGCSHSALLNYKWVRRISIFSAVLLVLVGFMLVLIRQNHEIDKKNRELEQQKAEIQLRESELLTQNAYDALSAGDRITAIENALAALPTSEGERPYYAMAEKTLIEAIGYWEDGQGEMIRTHRTLRLNEDSFDFELYDFCVSSDGTRVTCTDRSGTIICYDTDTWDIMWTTSFIGQNSYAPISILYCQINNCVIVFSSMKIIAYSQDTGHILWTLPSYLHPSSRLLLSEDHSILLFWSSNLWELNAVSTQDGKIVQTIDMYDIAAPYFDGKCSYSNQNWYIGDDTACALSDDGRTYAGCFIASASDDTEDQLGYYVLDMESGTGRIIYTQPIGNTDDIAPYACVTDDGRNMIVMQTETRNGSTRVSVEMFDLVNNSLAWSLSLPWQDDHSHVNKHEIYHQVMGANILIGYHDTLCLLNLETGSNEYSLQLDSPIGLLSAIDDHTYRMVLNNGKFLYGEIMENRIVNTVEEYSTGIEIENNPQGSVAYYYMELSGASVEAVTDDQMRTTLVVAEKDEIFNLEVYQFMEPGELEIWHEVKLQSEYENIFNTGLTHAGSDRIALGMFSRKSGDEYHTYYECVDTGNLTSQHAVEVDVEYLPYGNDIVFLPDGSGYIRGYGTGHATLHELDSGKEIILQYEDFVPLETYITVTSDMQTIIVQEGIDKFVVWQNMDNPVEYTFPEYVTTADSVYTVLGDNGIFTKAFFGSKYTNAWEIECGIAEFDINHGIATVYHFDPLWENDLMGTLCAAKKTKSHAIYANDTVYLFGNRPETSNQLDVGTTVLNMEYILDDTYLLVQTIYGILIYDLDSGDVVYKNPNFLDYNTSHHQALVYEDLQNNRLYIVGWKDTSDTYGICIDMNNWIEMARIPGMIGYDAKNNMVYRAINSNERGIRIAAAEFPGTQGLMEMARVFLNQDK